MILCVKMCDCVYNGTFFLLWYARGTNYQIYAIQIDLCINILNLFRGTYVCRNLTLHLDMLRKITLSSYLVKYFCSKMISVWCDFCSNVYFWIVVFVILWKKLSHNLKWFFHYICKIFIRLVKECTTNSPFL